MSEETVGVTTHSWLKQRYWSARRRVLRIFPNIPPRTSGEAEPPRNRNDSGAWTRHANYLLINRSLAEAVKASDTALALDPSNVTAERIGISARLFACDWRRRVADEQRITKGLLLGQNIIGAFPHRAISNSEAENQMLARLLAKRFPTPEMPLWQGEIYQHDKIRVAYISTDFRDHVVAHVMAGCFEHHDKSRFETIAISQGPDDGSAMRKRLEAAFDHFVDVASMRHSEIAAIMRARQIDIAVDLMGYSRCSDVLAYRPAPVQVNYLGYPGTMGAGCIDYIIADPFLIPEENRVYYSERVAYLPHTYMPHDRQRRIAEATPSRIEAGLPPTGFVFAGYSETHKISPNVFEIWMRLLSAVKGSVLWLRSANDGAISNLRREAKAHGVAPERLVFASRLPLAEDHLARLRLADLFLDTVPYNAHTTASDALWAGVPVLTCLGNTFSARVAAGLLHAIGVPELVTRSLADYEDVARTLAEDVSQLARIKLKLMRNRDTHPLFDTACFTRNLEKAYSAMWERQQTGQQPDTITIA